MNLKKILGTAALMGAALVFSPLKANAQELETWFEQTPRVVMDNVVHGPNTVEYNKFKESDKTVTYGKILNNLLEPIRGIIWVEFDDGRYMKFCDEKSDLIVDSCVLLKKILGTQCQYEYADEYFKSNPSDKLIMDEAQKKFDMYLKKIQLARLKQSGF